MEAFDRNRPEGRRNRGDNYPENKTKKEAVCYLT